MERARDKRGYITVTFVARRDDETNQYAVHCTELGVSSSGRNLDQAFERISEATLLYLNTLEDVGEQERIFVQRDIHIIAGDPPEASERKIAVRIRPEEYAAARDFPVPVAV